MARFAMTGAGRPFPWRRGAGKHRNGFLEIRTVDVLNKRDDVASGPASATVENLLFEIDRKPVLAAASRAWPAAIDTAAQPNPAPGKLILDAGRARVLDDCGVDHG
jgi:hypothetical protein